MAEDLKAELHAPESAAMAKWVAATIQHLPAEMHAVVDTVVITTMATTANVASSRPKVVPWAAILTAVHKALAKTVGASVPQVLDMHALQQVAKVVAKSAPILATAIVPVVVDLRRRTYTAKRSAWSTRKNSSTPMLQYV